MDGRKPTFIDATDSWFLIPYHIIRFVELPLNSVEAGRAARPAAGPIVERSDDDEDEEGLEDGDEGGDEDLDDASEELLQRIREV